MKALITGGLGFIGSNLAHKLVSMDYDVTILDAVMLDLGANFFNIEEIKDKVNFVKGDVRNKKTIETAVKDKDIIFHFAGQTDHLRSIEKPYEEVDMKINGIISVLEACKKNNQQAKIIFSSTRAVYGDSANLPVNETSETNPKSMYAITSLAAEKILRMYQNLYSIRTTSLRLVNIYGPRHQMKRPYGVFNYFIKQALSKKPITVMGKRNIIRDFLFVGDVCDACIECIKNQRTDGEVLNVGSGKGTSFTELANKIRQSTGGEIKMIAYTQKLEQVEPGDFVADIAKIKKFTSWRPKTPLEGGIKNT